MADWYDDFASGAVADLAAAIFFQRFMRPMAFKQEPDEALIDSIITKKLPPLLDYLEGQLPDEATCSATLVWPTSALSVLLSMPLMPVTIFPLTSGQKWRSSFPQ